MELVVFIGSDKESWGQIAGIINRGTWDKIIIVKSSQDDFPAPEGSIIIKLDSSKSITEMKNYLNLKLKDKFSTFEAHLSVASGNGKEHMALISALLSIPVGIRLVAFTKNGIEFIN